MRGKNLRFLLPVLLVVILAACAPAMHPTPAGEPSQPTSAPAAEQTSNIQEGPTPARTQAPEPVITPEALPEVEPRTVEMEWPERVRMGESDIIRLALIPVKDGYVAKAEFPDHTMQTKDVAIPRPDGYELYATARLDGVGFDIAPTGDQVRFVPQEEEIAWRWTLSPRAPGQHRLSIELRLRWVPGPGVTGPERESLAYSRGINVQVSSFLGMSRSQAASGGVVSLLLGCGFLLAAVAWRQSSSPRRQSQEALQVRAENSAVVVELVPGMALGDDEMGLLRALFASYRRLAIENEFLSGYSGARTFLVRPVRMDNCDDALTIVKIGPRAAIQQEFANYETFVKDRLPPVTARIQRSPVVLSARKTPGQRAAVQYTFIAEPGRSPVSLRRALLEQADPALLERLFETFGPHWWMQRRPHTFRLGQEYDSLLPPHYVLEPLEGACARGMLPGLSDQQDPASLHLSAGDIVFLQAFRQYELRPDGKSLALAGAAPAGQPALRLRWLSANPPNNTPARVTATRADLLYEWTAGFDRFGLPDPLAILPALLDETVNGTRSVIHGDLNLENVLVGPGSLVWLIDFAQTREGHPLYDFAHLESELIAHVLAPAAGTPRAFLDMWRDGQNPLVHRLHGLAGRCLFDPARPREYTLALFMACTGALKYPNLPALSKHCLYLAAANLAEQL